MKKFLFVLVLAFFISGCDGKDGATGVSGLTGVQGFDGQLGATGAAGSNGATGAAGSNGATGAAGSNGADGADGSNGADGIVHGLPDGQHLNYDNGDVSSCNVGYDWDHANGGTTCLDGNGFDVLGYDINGYDAYGCTASQTYSLDSLGDGSNIAACI